jgi:hypothetical protein
MSASTSLRFEDFVTPPSRNRPAPFWAINDVITPEETARQMSDMIDVGYHGGFFHSRSGLATEYLGTDWFDSIRAALDVAEKRDGYFWLYDEDGFPSGNCGGAVVALDESYSAASLVPLLLSPGAPMPDADAGEVRAVYAIDRDGLTLRSAERIDAAKAGDKASGERLVLCVQKGRSRRHGRTNLLNPEAVGEFIRLTHQRCADELGDDLGARRIPGIFTDEPNNSHDCRRIPWYDGLPDLYSEWHGRDLWADLPLLFFNTPESRLVRLLIQRSLHRQFVEGFSKPIYDWCEQHNLGATGHYNAEDTLQSQLQNCFGGVMAHYRYQQIPGVDHLFRNNERFLPALKQVSSAARQLGGREVLCEIFGGSRHSVTFAELLWLGHLDVVAGVNYFCPHLTWYSAAGRSKRDWPQTFSYQQTYWPELRGLHDYFTRQLTAMRAGEPDVEVLLLQPMDSAAASLRFGIADAPGGLSPDTAAVDYLDRTYRRAMDAILESGRDADLGDETLIGELGKVKGDRFVVGTMQYRTVVIPPSMTWRPRTFELLSEFVGNGGRVIFLGELPAELDCADAADAWRGLAQQCQHIPVSRQELQAALEKVTTERYRLRTADGRMPQGTLVQHRTDGKQEIFYIVNNDHERGQDYTLSFVGDAPGELAIWDAMAARRYRAEVTSGRYDFSLPARGAVMLVAGDGAAEGAEAPPRAVEAASARVETLGDEWRFARDEPNVLILDRLSYTIDGGETWSETMPEYKAREQIAERLGVADALRMQPWKAIKSGLFDGKQADLRLRYCFENGAGGSVNARFVLERLARARGLSVNGQEVSLSKTGWLWDRQFGAVDVGALLKKGENVIEASLPVDALTEIEAAYLAGDFGVALTPERTTGTLVPEPERLTNASWVDQGYPFYTGRMIYQTKVTGKARERTLLRLPDASAVLTHVRVNGAAAGDLLALPYVLELTDALSEGENELEIEIVASRQNLLGPLHTKEGEDLHACGPFAFATDWFMLKEFCLLDYGLLGGAELLRI